ncbi:alpha/beta hydrolase fold domain-containing protein [Flavobacterium sp. TP390]|uniref:Alpha/beta hydrolase fold domain-containing protein n=1 Tax=Flavobacterium profundi TaxID=1774945 RepID=A0A6I4IJY7_9FLAO|nr:alpha/beta hydrolase [Flavobacterium profundi]MVO08281.1 alpha/beta hydrolase fold domain-containing protein [Flavobacterium profundi]
MKLFVVQIQKNSIILIFFILINSNAMLLFAQQMIQKDTSYTIHSEYIKQKRKYPQITIVKPDTTKNTITVTHNIIYNKKNNKPLHLDAYYFKSKDKLPAVFLIHGGGWKSGNKSMLQPLAQSISKKRYQCFSIEYSLSNEAKYPQSIDDILEAITFVKKEAAKFSVDTSKTVILGCSSGGQMASLIGTKYPKKIQAIVNLDGILAFHHPESKEGKLASKWLGGTYEEKPEVWQEASALSHVNENTPPILFINSQFERFHAGRDDMIQILNQYHIYNQIKQIENSPHTFWLFHPWFNETTICITQFLDKFFKSNP